VEKCIFTPVGVMRTCIELSRYQVFRDMGIGTWIVGVEEATVQSFAPENGSLSEGPFGAAGSQLCCLVWPRCVSPSRSVFWAQTGMFPDGSDQARRDVGTDQAS